MRKTKISLESKEANKLDFNLLFDTDFPPQLKDLIEGKDEKLLKEVDTAIILNNA